MKLKYVLDPRRWWAVIQAYTLKTILPFHIVEQIMYRSIMCKDCTKRGKCDGECGCKTPALYYSYHLSCSKGNWHSFLGKKEWEMFKEIMAISFKI